MDFVIIWVDGDDPEWRAQYGKYALIDKGDTREVRFRDWNNLKYWFRGVEKFAPWVDKIHFVTCGHYPEWLNRDAPKLNLVKHSDYIPEKYLPTFNSCTIELNLHRIEGLSEEFVYFNDDFFIIDHRSPEHYFRNGLPCDIAALNMLNPEGIAHNILTVLSCVNENFDKREVMKKNFGKWYNPKYGKYLFRTLLLTPWPRFGGLLDPHLPNSFLKSTFDKVWKANEEILDRTCRDRFRGGVNVNQYLIRYWQLMEGNFHPYNTVRDSIYLDVNHDTVAIAEDVISNRRKSVVVLNDGVTKDFDSICGRVIESFEAILPEKSIYEK